MVLILGVAGAAIIALNTYNKAKNRDPEMTRDAVVGLRQSTGVLLAIGRAIVAVLDALQLITSASTNGGGLRIGQRIRDTEDAGI